jgi:HEAT repeat protein
MMKTCRVVESLTLGLEHSNPDVRAEAAHLLGNMGIQANAAVKKLCELAECDPEDRVACYACEALGLIGDPAALDTLYECTYDESLQVCDTAEKAIALILEA